MSKRRVWLLLGIVILLVLTAVPTYRAMMVRSREAVLQTNLVTMRDVIKQYAKDKKKAPQSLEDLVTAGYLRELPFDPMTNSRSTWQPVVADVAISPEATDRGIADVQSGATAISSRGTTYSVW
jgi:general secretion pathway protein G